MEKYCRKFPWKKIAADSTPSVCSRNFLADLIEMEIKIKINPAGRFKTNEKMTQTDKFIWCRLNTLLRLIIVLGKIII